MAIKKKNNKLLVKICNVEYTNLDSSDDPYTRTIVPVFVQIKMRAVIY